MKRFVLWALALASLLALACAEEKAAKPIEMSKEDQLEFSKAQNQVNVLQLNLKNIKEAYDQQNAQLQQAAPKFQALVEKLREKYKCKDCTFDENLALVPAAKK